MEEATGPLAVSAEGTAAGATRNALVVENRLVQPIAFSMGDTYRMISPGDTVRLAVDPGESIEAHWAMVQPSARGRMLGREVEGTIASGVIGDELREVVDAHSGDTLRFAPSVINRTRRPLRVTVIGESDTIDCRCVVPPRDSILLGYYLFSARTVVRVRDDRGATARFDALGDQVDESSGAVSITVRPEDFRSR